MNIEQFKLTKLKLEIEGKIMTSRRIHKSIKDNNLSVLIEFYGGETEFLLTECGELYQDGKIITRWYYIDVEELNYFTMLSNKKTSVSAEFVAEDFNLLLEQFRDIADKEFHKDWHKYGKQQFAKIGKLSVGRKYITRVSDAVAVETEVYEGLNEVGLQFRVEEKLLKIKLFDNNITYFNDKQFHGCIKATQDNWQFAYVHEHFNVFKDHMIDLGLIKSDLSRVLNCIADIILYRSGKKRRDSTVDSIIMGEDIREGYLKHEEQRIQQERAKLLDEGKT